MGFGGVVSVYSIGGGGGGGGGLGGGFGGVVSVSISLDWTGMGD